ncbi:hypothetical protein ASZ90_012715 [hydrocarbon metagenome]|uniref:Uncharacterized protein n=1 Tax=hydrocarbon metagenome TaxID=938273 RepID=A0A0W8F9T4_9ZZZZ
MAARPIGFAPLLSMIYSADRRVYLAVMYNPEPMDAELRAF